MITLKIKKNSKRDNILGFKEITILSSAMPYGKKAMVVIAECDGKLIPIATDDLILSLSAYDLKKSNKPKATK